MTAATEQTGEDLAKEPEGTPNNTPVKKTSPTLKGYSVRQKIYLGFAGLILLSAANSGYTLFKLDDVEQIAKSSIEKFQPAANLFQRLAQDLNGATTLLNNYMLTGQKDQKEEFTIITQDITERLTEARYLDIVKEGKVKNESLDRAETLLLKYLESAGKLYNLRDNNENNRGLILAIDTLNPYAIAFLNNVNILVTSDDLDTSDLEAVQIRSQLEELRYIWVQMMSSMRIFISSQGNNDLANFRSYNQLIGGLLDKLVQSDVDIGFGELDEMVENHKTYNVNMLPVIEMFLSGDWRMDSFVLKTEVRPVLDELRVIFEGTADKLLNEAINSGKALTQAQEQISSSAILSFFVILWLGALLALKITGNIVPPIRSLMTAAEQISSGDLNAEVMITTKDEIGMLGNSFNTMVYDLRSSKLKELSLIDELSSINEELEHRVEERTEELGRSETKIRAVLDNIGEGILVLDEDGRIETINPAAEEIFGTTEKEAIGINSALFIKFDETNQDAGGNGHDFHTLFTSNNNQQPKEHVGHRADGRTFPMEYVVSSMEIGEKLMHVCIVRDITARKETEATLAEVQQKLVDGAHKSGMADMATGVLHNIGNILNSVNLAGEEIIRISNGSKIKGLIKANEMLEQNQDNMGDFLVNDDKGKRLPAYYLKIGKVLNDEVSSVNKEARALIEKTTMMKEVISTQQSYAQSGFHTEQLAVDELVEDSLKIQIASLQKWGVKINKKYGETPLCTGQKSKLLQVITNLIKNSKEAMDNNDDLNKPKELTIKTGTTDDGFAYIQIKDNGCGISSKQLAKIFNHGFTTKETGHGFGLHTSANAMTEMRGSLKVDSEGTEKGACFTITIPLYKKAA